MYVLVAGKRHRGDSANEVADSTNSKKQRLDCVCTNAAPESAGAYRMLIDGQIVYKRGRVISSDVEPSESDNSDDETYHPDDEVSSSESSESSLSYGKRRSFHKKGKQLLCQTTFSVTLISM